MFDPVVRFFRSISTKSDFRQALKSVLGYGFVACVPRSAEQPVFTQLARRKSVRDSRRIDRGKEDVAPIVQTVLGEHHADSSTDEIAAGFYAMKFEDDWGRWRASHSADWAVTTEVEHLHYVTDAQRDGRGVVLWGTSFCGTLFQKIALARAGVSLTQLSSYDHGKSHHNTLLGRRITEPMFCLPENQYLNERIMIPQSGQRKYLYRLGKVLKGKGCVWIACHGSRHQRNLDVTMLGQPVHLPGGAPTIAMRYNAALIPAHTERVGKFHYRVVLAPPIELNDDESRQATVQRLVQDYADLLGKRLLEQPASWNWLDAAAACGLV
jgi:lauroyl/myristoyl acyltransferase